MSLAGGQERVPVTILQDTGAFDSFIPASALHFSDETDTGSFLTRHENIKLHRDSICSSNFHPLDGSKRP